MSEASAALADLDAALAQFGQTVTLQRMATGPDGKQVVNECLCRAVVRLEEPSALTRVSDDAPDSMVILSPTMLASRQWPGPGLPPLPRRDDKLIDIRGFTMNVEAVVPFDIGGQIVRIELRCRGGQDNNA